MALRHISKSLPETVAELYVKKFKLFESGSNGGKDFLEMRNQYVESIKTETSPFQMRIAAHSFIKTNDTEGMKAVSKRTSQRTEMFKDPELRKIITQIGQQLAELNKKEEQLLDLGRN
jgi:hypothetical protein